MKKHELVKPAEPRKFRLYQPTIQMKQAAEKAQAQPPMIAMVSNLAFVRKDQL